MQAHMGFAIHKTQTHQATQRQDMLLVSILFIDSIHPDSRCHDLSLYVCEAELFSADYLPV